ncbi:shikimate kinase [Cellulomonas chengniuliangii]|uniref:Shikimate kinase n=1 Tax=Cellulomonas chengniuliangii TaxID=2968084 RepID=A0ABY5L5B3_9CELL|nr:shikimate kinase [Cellulomonas chengniuliangii]MCC2308415.1 shikimate kinase [Cellulomonas chengniuliangii]MCC2317432.1 shikimate kinase [Cellulomonas chengniuliangii]UUI76792.1 shikimate kinase [Cellulomonas chengniuliangii]
MPRPLVVLVGPPGSGKSTVATALAALRGVTARETDADVEAAAGRRIGEIFVEEGEERFRELEKSAAEAALDEHDGVVALGGGAVLDPGIEEQLAAYSAAGGLVVFLDVSLAHAAPRVGFNISRPLLLGNPRAQWQSLMEARRPVYERVSGLRVSTDGRSAAEVADLIHDAVTRHTAGGSAVDEGSGT